MQDADVGRPVTLITGTSSGIGLATAVEMAQRGHRVFASMRDLDKRGDLEAAARDAGVSVETIALDVTSAESIRRAVADVEARAGGIDVLINNAGIVIRGFFEELSPEEVREVFETNFFGAAEVMRAVLPGMRSRRSGRIVNVSSLSPHLTLPTMAAYASSKAALEAMTEALRYEVAPAGIQAVVVVLGAFKSKMTDTYGRFARATNDPSLPTHGASQVAIAKMNKRLGRLIEPTRNAVVVIAQAATDPSPPFRYYAGRPAIVASRVLRVVPRRALHALLTRALALPS
jgi:NAD(P)-dependent dehydrogenase (short-subunit alcohol dehydrogenase family)